MHDANSVVEDSSVIAGACVPSKKYESCIKADALYPQTRFSPISMAAIIVLQVSLAFVGAGSPNKKFVSQFTVLLLCCSPSLQCERINSKCSLECILLNFVLHAGGKSEKAAPIDVAFSEGPICKQFYVNSFGN